MSLAAAFKTSTPFTAQDVEKLVEALDRDPTNSDLMFTFGKSMYGQVPFNAKLFMAAKNEMLRRYADVHLPQAQIDAYAAEHSVYYTEGRGGETVKHGEKELTDARVKLSEMENAKNRFGEIADSNAATMAHVAFEAQKAERERKERQAMLAHQAAEAERQHVQAMVDNKNRITAVAVQTGKLNQPVTAPKVAKFKQRVV